MTELINILKTLPTYVLGLFNNHTILFIVTAALFVFVAFFSNKVANKLRSVFVLAALLLVVFSFISQSWSRIALIAVSLLLLLVCRIIGYTISEIRINRRNKRLAERALEKAAKRRGSWENKRGYSGARKLIIEPEYIPEEMDQDEINDVITNEVSDTVPLDSDETKELTDKPVVQNEKWGAGNVFKAEEATEENSWGAGNVFKADSSENN